MIKEILYIIFVFLIIGFTIIIGYSVFDFSGAESVGCDAKEKGSLMLLVFLAYYSHWQMAVKLLVKEFIFPSVSNKIIFFLSSFIDFFFSNGCLGSYSMEWFLCSCLMLSFLFCIFLLFLSLSVYGVIMAGWSSNSRYAFFGCFAFCCPNG